MAIESKFDSYAHALVDIANHAVSNPDLDSLLIRAVKTVAAVLSADHVLIIGFDAVGGALQLRSRAGDDEYITAQVIQHVEEQLRKNGLSRSSSIIIIEALESTHSHLLSLKFMHKHDLATGMAAFIRNKTGHFDLLLVLSNRPRLFANEEIQFFHSIVNVLALSFERWRTEEQWALNLERMVRIKQGWETTVDALPQLVCVVDKQGHVTRTNRTLEAWCLGTVQSIRGTSMHGLLHPACDGNSCQLQASLYQAWKSIESELSAVWELYDRIIDRDLRFYLRKSLEPAYDSVTDMEHYAVLVIEDNSDRKRLERTLERFNQDLVRRLQEKTRQLTAVNQELRALSAQRLAWQEAERKRVVSELHDAIGQDMSEFKFRLESLLKDFKAPTSEEHEKKKRLQDVIDKVQYTIDEVRRISMDLRPSMLDDLGIIPTINWFCREFESTYINIKVIKRIDVEENDILEFLKIEIFRILQEAFNNVAKHAAADTVFVELTKTEEIIKLSIKDNGRGFEAALDSGLSKGFGLSSMRQRVELTNGIFSIASSLGTGTAIKVLWPYGPWDKADSEFTH